jgi:F-type H+-transporting ATPase subunit a
MLTSPLEQFELLILRPASFFGFDYSLTNASLYLFLAFFTFNFIFIFGLSKPKIIPTRIQYICETLFIFVIDIIKQQVGNKGLKYLPILFTIFILILFSNLVGLLPFAFTPTSHLILTLAIAFSCNLGLILIGFYENGIKFLLVFVPKGGPLWLMPLIIIIEFFSYLLRTLSLSIRLFANMMAGHTLLHILSSFIVAFINNGFLAISLFPFILVVAVLVLELGIAFLQAYVFLILLCIYLNDSFNPSH